MATYEDAITALRNADAKIEDAKKRGVAPDPADLEAASRLSEIAARLKGGAAPEQPKDKAPSKAALAADKFKAGVAGNVGLAGSLLDALGSIGMGGGMAPSGMEGPPPDVLGPQFQRGAEEFLGVQGYKPQTRGEQFIAAPMEMLGGATIPGLGVVGMVPRAAKIPAALFELSSAITGGLGEAGGRAGGEITGWYEPEKGALIGAVLGSLAPVPANTALTMAGNRLGRFLPGAQREAAGGKVERELQELLGPRGKDSLERALELATQIPGFKPTLGQASGAPGIIAREANLQDSSAAALEKASEWYDANLGAIGGALGDRFPSADISPIAPGKQALTAAERKLSTKQQQVEKSREALADRFERMKVGEYGEKLRAKRNERMIEAQNIKNQKYNDVYAAADAANLRVDMSDVDEFVARTVAADKNAFQDMPRTFQKVLSKGYRENAPAVLSPDGKPKSKSQARFQELHSLMREASREAKTTTNPTHAYFLGQLSDVLRSKVRGFEEAGLGEVSEKLRDANRFYNEGYREVFKEGAGGRLDPRLAMAKFGETTDDEDIVRKLFFKEGKEKGIKDFFRIYGDDPEALDMLRGGILDIFVKEAIDNTTRTISPRAAESFFNRYHHALERLPGVRAELSNAKTANEAMIARAQTLHEQSKRVAKSTLAKVTGSENPADDVAKAFASPKAMTALAGTARKVRGGPESLRRAVAEHIMAQPDPLSYFAENRKVIQRALATHGADQAAHVGAKHMADLESLAEAMSMIQRNVPPTRLPSTSAVKDPVQERFGSSIRTIAAHHRSVAQGRGSAADAIINFMSKYAFKIREDHANALFEEAVYDPNVARTLAAAAREGKPSSGIRRRLAAHMLSLGIRLPAAQDE